MSLGICFELSVAIVVVVFQCPMERAEFIWVGLHFLNLTLHSCVVERQRYRRGIRRTIISKRPGARESREEDINNK